MRDRTGILETAKALKGVKKEPCKIRLEKALKEIQTISHKANVWKERYQSLAYFTCIIMAIAIAELLIIIF